MEFGYWKVKSRGHLSRMVIHYTGLKVKEYYPESFPAWLEKKNLLAKDPNCPFPNLPYFNDGEICTTESSACPVAICIKADRRELLGSLASDKVEVANLMGVCQDLFEFAMKLIKMPSQDALAELDSKVPSFLEPKLAGFTKALSDRAFFLHYVTLPDLYLAYLYDIFQFISEALEIDSLFEPFPALKSLHSRVWSLAGLEEFCHHSENSFPVLPVEIMQILGQRQPENPQEPEEAKETDNQPTQDWGKLQQQLQQQKQEHQEQDNEQEEELEPRNQDFEDQPFNEHEQHLPDLQSQAQEQEEDGVEINYNNNNEPPMMNPFDRLGPVEIVEEGEQANPSIEE